MCDGMVAFQTRALSSSSSSTSSFLAHRLAASALLLLFTLLPNGHASGCAWPPGVQHGDLLNQTEANRGSFPPGTLLTYGCEPGYTADGTTTIICTSSGAWSHQPPHCIRSGVCSPPTEPENGGYRCHPSPCHRLTQKTVIEYFCDEGFALKGDYKFLTCQNGEWDGPMQISCRLTQDKEPSSPLGIPALSIVASTASSVALILLLVVLFVLVQPKLKSFHHNRREMGVSGESSSIMVEGVQVTLPSYEEAVYGSGGPGGASGPPPSPPPPSAAAESRVPIVLSEGLPQGATGGQGASRTRHNRNLDFSLPSTSSSSSFSSRRHAETVLVHQAPSSSSSSSSWAREHPGGACAGPLPLRRDSESSDQHSLLSVTSTDDFSDDIPLLKEA
ncbi:sushi domain-containing protein 6 [Cyclopterus lumpus]|uniref:Sushi domain containing 6 n=1 Tax=Cyclopterus lumpus TaxID=8103 RepID=A0A8C3GC00_CYCLU|nr:sushi domain-containing protein 6 [Cyclopterus lumpus]XP_034384286.1 sushi domain-containing protein 6 [Cyclopterus lumpus]XP_034384287.1 sushi domain-containing protein 6 [Cyclopterus lumpus]XP_034384288.1 sushi domain-containing protein 6 [Cyclopterus lumpus]